MVKTKGLWLIKSCRERTQTGPLFSLSSCAGSVWIPLPSFLLVCFSCPFGGDTVPGLFQVRGNGIELWRVFLGNRWCVWVIDFVATVRINHGLEKATRLKTELCVWASCSHCPFTQWKYPENGFMMETQIKLEWRETEFLYAFLPKLGKILILMHHLILWAKPGLVSVHPLVLLSNTIRTGQSYRDIEGYYFFLLKCQVH